MTASRTTYALIREVTIAVTGSLLSSSCCLLQLGLNAMSVGCAGFAVLDPYRKPFLLLTFCSLLWASYRATKRTGRVFTWRVLTLWTVATSIAFLPNALKYLNENASWIALPLGADSLINRIPQSVSVNSVTTPTPLVLRIEDGVHCEACANRLKTVLAKAHADPALQALSTSDVVDLRDVSVSFKDLTVTLRPRVQLSPQQLQGILSFAAKHDFILKQVLVAQSQTQTDRSEL